MLQNLNLHSSCLLPRLSAWPLLLSALLLAACGNSGRMQVEHATAAAEKQLQLLAGALAGDEVRNALILKTYAAQLSRLRPEFSPIARQLARDATTDGPLYRSLAGRFENARQGTGQFDSWSDQVSELKSIQLAAMPTIFSDALSDPVNVLADLSGGVLGRVNAISESEEQSGASPPRRSAGAQLVGNPNYGYWSAGAGGSFWQWYGQYAFFSALLGGNRHYYHDWARGRGYSYYHDVGRRHYTSPGQRSAQGAAEARARKSYRGNRPFQSPYARSRQGARNISRASGNRRPLFKSPYASSSRAGSRYPSSTRSGSSRTRRSSFRGK